MKRPLFLLLLTLLWIMPCISHGARPIQVTDMSGRRVTVPFDPERIVCIGPGALRLVVYLKAQNKVVGVEDMEKIHPRGRPYWLAHPELRDLPRCGPGGPVSINRKPDLETLLSLAPEVIFITYMKPALAQQVQETLKIPVVVLSYGAFATFDNAVFEALRIAGTILNRRDRAEAVIDYVESLRRDLERRTTSIPVSERPAAYVGGIGFRGAHGIESTEKHYAPFLWTHTENVAEDLRCAAGTHAFVDREMLLKLNPHVIFIDGGGLALVARDYARNPSYYGALRAFAEGRVYTLLPFNWYVTNVGTALADAYAVGKILYPDRFADIQPAQKADEIYRFLVGRPVYEQLKKDYGAIGEKAPFLK